LKIKNYLKFMFHKNLLTKLGLLFGVVILLTALGCKKTEPASTQIDEGAAESPSTTYQANESLTNEKTAIVSPTASPTSPAVSPASSPTAVSSTASPVASPSPTSPTPEAKTTDEDLALKQQAEKLAEIYGTFTNKDKEPYKNYKELIPYATTKMQAWLDTKVEKSQSNNSAQFYGATTKALSSAIIESSADAKKILVTVKQEEISATQATPQVSYKILLLNFVKEKEEWKLNGIYWQ
jgi:hypothetical protein